MRFTRNKRIALEILSPPALGAGWWVLATMPHVTWTAEGLVGHFGLVVVVTGYAYWFAGIPSLVYAAIMEWRFARGLDPRGWRSVGLSAVLGFISGGGIMVCLGWRRLWDPVPWLIFGGGGAVVGFILGLLIKRLSSERSLVSD